MSISTINTLLVDHLKTLSGLPTLQEENTANIGQTGVAFSRVTMLPARPSQLSVGTTGRNLLTGLLQVDLFVPQDEGVTNANNLVDSVIEHFPRGLTLVNGLVNVHVTLAWLHTRERISPFHASTVRVQWSSIT